MNDPFLNVDYHSLEAQTLRNLMKTVNFGAAYGMGPQKLSGFAKYAAEDAKVFVPPTRPCEKCGEDIPLHAKEHSRRPCMYGRARRDQERRGYVPAQGMYRKLLQAAGVPIERAAFHNRPEFRDKHDQYPPLQQGDYVPVWALVILRQSGLSALTSPKRPKVKKVIERLRRVLVDTEEQEVILGEHVLQKGPYAAACQALIGKL